MIFKPTEESSLFDQTDVTEYADLPTLRPTTQNRAVSAPTSKLKRKILRKTDDGTSFVSVESSFSHDSIVNIHDRSETESLCSISTIDSDLRQRLNRLKINIGKRNASQIKDFYPKKVWNISIQNSCDIYCSLE